MSLHANGEDKYIGIGTTPESIFLFPVVNRVPGISSNCKQLSQRTNGALPTKGEHGNILHFRATNSCAYFFCFIDK
jgi:hypothetical protein